MSDNSIKRVFSVLRKCAGQSDGVGFTDLRKDCGDLEAAQLSRVLKPLQDEKLIRKDLVTGRYHIGDGFLELARSALTGQDRESILRPIVNRLAESTLESAAYYEWDGNWIELRYKSEQPNSFHYINEGSRNHFPEHTFFRVIQAYLPDDKLAGILAMDKEQDFPGKTVFNEVRKNKFLARSEKLKGVISRVASPVFADGKIIGAIGVTLLQSKLTPETIHLLGEKVKMAAETATKRLTREDTK